VDSLVKINVGAAPNDGTGEPARDAFMKHNKNMDSIANALGAAGGIATLGADGRLPIGQTPAGLLLPTTAHDLNTYTSPGTYYQGAVSAATLANNYPVASVTGFLLVDTFGTATLQQFNTRVAPYQQFWRIKTGTSANAWSAWKEMADATTALTFQGVMAAAQDLNTYTQRGAWIVAASSVAQGGTNFPIGQSGVLVVYSAGYPGGTAATGANQVYIASNSNRQYFRSLVGGVWSAWDEVVRSSLLGVASGVATLDAGAKVPLTQLPVGGAGGLASLDGDGLVPESQLPPIPSGPAVGTPSWWPLRSSIPAGQIPLDGQTVSRATYPELTAMVLAGTLPVGVEATWQSDPTQRGKYTLGDGSTTIRLPDLNGKSAGSLGAVFLRGDGALSAGVNGAIHPDALQNHGHAVNLKSSAGSEGYGYAPYGGSGAQYGTEGIPSGARVAAETRALNATGVWTVHAFGAVVNPGSIDAAQLASDYAVMNAAVQTLNGQIQQSYGVGQTFQNVTGSRTTGVLYTNSTGRPIHVFFAATATGGLANTRIEVGGTDAASSFTPPDGSLNGSVISVNASIPPGQTYRVITYNVSGPSWREYR